MAGCRDCSTCTQNGAARTIINLGAGLLHVSTAGFSYVVKRAVAKHCPQCSHMLSSHMHRPDQPGWQLPTTQQPPYPQPGQYPQAPYGQQYPPQQPGPTWGQQPPQR